MATLQSCAITCDPSKQLHSVEPTTSGPWDTQCKMGSVSSLIEKQESPPGRLKGKSMASPRIRQPDGLFTKGITQRDLLNYLNSAKKQQKTGSKIINGNAFAKREHGSDDGENVYSKVYYRENKEIGAGNTTCPEGPRCEKARPKPSAFQRVAPKNFSSLQSLASRDEEVMDSISSLNMLCNRNSAMCQGSPMRRDSPQTHQIHIVTSHEDKMSESCHNSMNSLPLPTSRPGFKPPLGPISASMSHINHIGGSLDRGFLGSRDNSNSDSGRFSCKSMATLSRLLCYEENIAPYELSQSVEDVVRGFEKRLHEKELEVKSLRKNLNESDSAIAQVLDEKWGKELDELKRLYAEKLRQISQHAQRSQRTLQLQLYKVQQEKRRLQKELDDLHLECEEFKTRNSDFEQGQGSVPPKVKESKWEVCRKAGEVSLLKKQLKDSQIEVAKKLSELFSLKSELREAQAELQVKDEHIKVLKYSMQLSPCGKDSQVRDEKCKDGSDTKDYLNCETDDVKCRGLQQEGGTSTLVLQFERLKAELLLERRQSEAQAARFEAERNTWQGEKEKVIRYQKELQANYLEMYHRNQSLETQLEELQRLVADSKQQVLPWIERIESSDI
ncbi:NEDD4-binding protein 3 isoform X2 [Protopterus annectens]|uniref:NEDD4-binding protein 3 isoform X2 n=1 Tax=Protopterus annectens TaxID=7888 RepID=UPI001CFA21C0|nr:NEDD4-binding protein 3 isoform X2 [Protopterus annectens]